VYPNTGTALPLLLHCRCGAWSPRERSPGVAYQEVRCGAWGARPRFAGDTDPRDGDARGCGRTIGYVTSLPIGTSVRIWCPHCSGIVTMIAGGPAGMIAQWVDEKPVMPRRDNVHEEA
jgi:hypothetical protein